MDECFEGFEPFLIFAVPELIEWPPAIEVIVFEVKLLLGLLGFFHKALYLILVVSLRLQLELY